MPHIQGRIMSCKASRVNRTCLHLHEELDDMQDVKEQKEE